MGQMLRKLYFEAKKTEVWGKAALTEAWWILENYLPGTRSRPTLGWVGGHGLHVVVLLVANVVDGGMWWDKAGDGRVRGGQCLVISD